MMQMFRSATIKLTAAYLSIIMVISLLFSIAIYQVNFHEVNVRLENLQQGIIEQISSPPLLLAATSLRQFQADQASFQMLISLLYANLSILVAGGIVSYLLARRTLRPIEEAHEAQSRFTSDASHELRTPLTAMKTEIEVALRDAAIDPVEARELLESTLEEVDKLINVSDMLLKLSRLDYNRLDKKRLSLAVILKKVLKPLKEEAKRFDIETRKDPYVYGDEAALTELMTILIDNALKHGNPDTRIGIRIFQRRFTYVFEITNSGPTISRTALPHLFERFYRADDSRTDSRHNGYGLGLAIAKKIVDIHEGEIGVKSRDGLTTFTFSLPSTREGKITTK